MKTHARGIAAQEKYLQFMNDLYHQKLFNRRMMEMEYKISHQICTQLTKRGFIVLHNSEQYKWIGKEPSMQLAIDILIDVRNNNKYYLKSKKNTPNQLVINPVKKMERTIHQPVQEEVIHDTSNSKIVLILAVGAVIGFLIATLIWK